MLLEDNINDGDSLGMEELLRNSLANKDFTKEIKESKEEDNKTDEKSANASSLEITSESPLQDEYENSKVETEKEQTDDKQENCTNAQEEELDDLHTPQKENSQKNDEMKDKLQKIEVFDIFKMLIPILIGTGLELFFLFKFKDNRPNRIYYVVSFLFYIVAIFVPFLSVYLFYKFKKNIPTVESILNKKISKKGILNLIGLYRSTFLKNENGNIKNKTRANAELYFNFDSVMNSMVPWYPISKALKLIASSFIGLGILGTFIGFSEAMGDLTFDSPDVMMDGIRKLVSNGLTTAFNTSIIGVLCSLVYNFLIYYPLMHYVNGYFDNLCDELDSKYYISETEALMEYTMTHDKDGTPIPFSSSLNLIISNMNKQSEALDNFNNDLADRLSNLRNDMSASMDRISSSVSGDLSEKVLGSVQEEIEGLKESLVTATKELNQASESISSTIDKIDNEVADSIQEFNSALIDSLENSKEASVHLGKVPVQMGGITESLDKAGDKLSSVSDIISDNMNNVRDSLNGLFGNIKATQENVVDILGRVQTNEEYSGNNLRELTNETNEIIEGFKRIDESLASIFSKIGEEINKYNSTVSGTLGDYLSQFSNSSKEFSSTIYNTVSDFTNSLTSVNDTIKSIDESSDKFAATVKHLEKTLNK